MEFFSSLFKLSWPPIKSWMMEYVIAWEGMHKKRRGGNGNSYFKRIYYLISYRGFVRELINVPLKKINPQNKFLAFRFECNQFSIEYSQLFNFLKNNSNGRNNNCHRLFFYTSKRQLWKRNFACDLVNKRRCRVSAGSRLRNSESIVQ